jgi:hypothetical protein
MQYNFNIVRKIDDENIFHSCEISGYHSGMKFRVFWDVVPCSHVEVDRRFRGAYCFHHHGDVDGGSTHL